MRRRREWSFWHILLATVVAYILCCSVFWGVVLYYNDKGRSYPGRAAWDHTWVLAARVSLLERQLQASEENLRDVTCSVTYIEQSLWIRPERDVAEAALHHCYGVSVYAVRALARSAVRSR